MCKQNFNGIAGGGEAVLSTLYAGVIKFYWIVRRYILYAHYRFSKSLTLTVK